MEPWRIIAAVLAASVVASFTDWLFMGVLFHDRYNVHPEVWRDGRNEPQKIIQSQIVGLLSCAGFVALCLILPHQLRIYLKAAAFVALAGPIPLLWQNGLWMKLHPLVLGSHAVGWLARFVITAFACSLLFPPAH